MAKFRLIDMLPELSEPHDREALKVRLEDWKLAVREIFGASKNTCQLSERESATLNEPATQNLLKTLFGNSSYLSACIIQEPRFFCELVNNNPSLIFDTLINDLTQQRGSFSNDADLMRALRVAKRRVSLTTAVADICNIWELDQVTGYLSKFAELSLSLTLSHLLLKGAKQDVFKLRL